MQSASKTWSDQEIYFKYIDTFGYPPAEAKNLFAFSRSAYINQPMKYKNAADIIQRNQADNYLFLLIQLHLAMN